MVPEGLIFNPSGTFSQGCPSKLYKLVIIDLKDRIAVLLYSDESVNSAIEGVNVKTIFKSIIGALIYLASASVWATVVSGTVSLPGTDMADSRIALFVDILTFEESIDDDPDTLLDITSEEHSFQAMQDSISFAIDTTTSLQANQYYQIRVRCIFSDCDARQYIDYNVFNSSGTVHFDELGEKITSGFMGYNIELVKGIPFGGTIEHPDSNNITPYSGRISVKAYNDAIGNIQQANYDFGFNFTEGESSTTYSETIAPLPGPGWHYRAQYVCNPNPDCDADGLLNAGFFNSNGTDVTNFEKIVDNFTAINFTLLFGESISGTLSRGLGGSSATLEISLSVQRISSTEPPIVITGSSTKTLIIEQGLPSKDYDITVPPLAAGDVYRVFYNCFETCIDAGYLSVGFYAVSKTVPDIADAEFTSENTNIDIEILADPNSAEICIPIRSQNDKTAVICL